MGAWLWAAFRGGAPSVTLPSMRRAPLLLALLLPWVLLYPLPWVFASALVTSPLSEGVGHLWGWWAAIQERSPFSITTTLLNYPDGLSFQLIDPLHLLPYALGALLGPAAGYNAVLVWGVALGGLAGGLLAAETGADRDGQILGVAIGASVPTTLAVAVDGITEGLGVGWVGVQLAALLALRRGPTPGRVAALAAALWAGTLSGPYNAVWIALIDVPVGLWMLRRTRAPLVAALLAGIAAVPYLAALAGRDATLPGGEARAGLGLARVVEPWRASAERGVDLLDLFVPAPLTGGYNDLPHTAYLGVVTLGLAAIGARRAGRAAWPWLLGAACFAALALGPYLSIGGQYPQVGGRSLVGPAGLLALYTPLGRLSRWYRAGAVAALLLVPLATRALRGRGAWIAAALVLLDARLLAPLPRTLPTIDAAPAPALAALQGPIAELPPIHPLFTRGAPADLNLLLQMSHGQPTNGTLHSLPGLATHADSLRVLRRIAADEAHRDDDARAEGAWLAERGYRWLAVYRVYFRPSGLDRLSAALGAPVAQDERIVVWALR